MVPVADLFLDRGRELRNVRRAGILAAYRAALCDKQNLHRWLKTRAVPVMIILGIE